MRDQLKRGIEKADEAFWGNGPVDPALLTVRPALANAQAVSDFLATLQPGTEAQKAALALANGFASMVEQSRLLISLQMASGPVSWILIAILFFGRRRSFSPSACTPDNALVTAALTFGALSIAFAIFLIFELGMPYTGLFRVSPAALEQTIEFIDK